MNPLHPNQAASGAPNPTQSARQERMPLFRLAVSCPRCGRRPALRATPTLVEMLRGKPADTHLITYQCHRTHCGQVYDITAAAYHGAS